MTHSVNKFLLEGLDFLGKSTLIDGIQNQRGFHGHMHFSKPKAFDCYNGNLLEYQKNVYRIMFSILRDAKYTPFIFDRAHLSEYVYSPLYRKYNGSYVFDIERVFGMQNNFNTRLILLTENFKCSKHFIDDGLSFDITKREQEQELFIAAFEKSCIPDKRIICVTGQDGNFRNKAEILFEVTR